MSSLYKYTILSHLSKKSVYSTIYHMHATGYLLLHVHFLNYSVCLCHAAKAPIVLAVKQSAKLHGSFRRQARQHSCMEG